jgi:outer membrane lipoprotein-sorting protein
MVRRTYIWAVLLLALSSSGCLFHSHRVAQRVVISPTRNATLADLLAYNNNESTKIKTINATVDIDTSVGGSKKGKVTEFQQIRGYILVRRPEMLRMIGLFPVVRNRAFDMVSDANGFKLSIPSKNKFIIGPPTVTHESDNTLENLRPQVIYDALLLHTFDPQTEIAVLEQGAETVNANSKKVQELPTYIVDIIRKDGVGWYLWRKIIFSRADLLPHRQLIYDEQGNLVTEAKYEAYKDFNGIQFPTDIDIWRPKEEYSIGITVVKLTINEPLTDDQFALTQPPGSQLVDLGAAPSTASSNPPTRGGGDPPK